MSQLTKCTIWAGVVFGSLLIQAAAQAEPPRTRPGGKPVPAEKMLPGLRTPAEKSLPDGVPETRIAPFKEGGVPKLLAPRWRLGVYAYNTPTGVVVTGVVPQSGAWRVGLEPRDRIVAVEGFQVGVMGHQLYALGDELQLRARKDGRVKLLVQNCRNDDLLMIDVQLDRTPWFDRKPPRRR